MRLQGKCALVTGAGRGIGRAICRRFASEGADIAAVDLKTEMLEEVGSEVRGHGRRCELIQADVANVADIERMVIEAYSAFGVIDILVNNAGVGNDRGLFTITEADWDWINDVNAKGSFFCLQYVAREMRKRKAGKIINIASVAGIGWTGNRNVAYTASKAAVLAFTKTIAHTLGPDNINVNAICPGVTRTDLYYDVVSDIAGRKGITPEEIVSQAERTLMPLGRSNSPDDIAAAAVFLASDDASNITGHAITVDSGISL